MTNAAKYGALSTQFGHVLVRWYRKLNGDARRLLFNGRKPADQAVEALKANLAMALSIVRDLIPYEFGGTVDLVVYPEGVRCRRNFDRLQLSDCVASAASAASSSAH